MCSNPAKTDGADCDDGNMCNGISTCQSGVCTQTTPPVTCPASDACHTAGTCNTSTGMCSNPAKTDGADCDDGNMCKDRKSGQSGKSAELRARRISKNTDGCHTAGTCNTSTGMCSNPAKTDGADCDDGNMCNGISTCQSGVCTQTTPSVTCPASDACHTAGTCNTSTGMCSNPAKTDGADCDDGNMC